MKTSSVGYLKRLMEGMQDSDPVAFCLNNNGTALSGGITANVEAPDGEHRQAAKLIIGDEVTLEEAKCGYPSQARIGLPAEFLQLCERDGVTPEIVLQGFIADLCGIINTTDKRRPDGMSSNGSDERHMAREYYRRVGYREMAQFMKGKS